VRRFPLESLAQLDLLPASGENGLRRSMLLRFIWADEPTTDVQGVGPVAAKRIHDLLQIICFSE